MYYLFLVGSLLAWILPRSVCYLLAEFLGTLHFYISKKDREAVIYNLSPVIDDESKLKRCAKGVFINFLYYLVDFFRYPKLNKNFIKKYVRISGLENLDQSLKKNKGVVALTAHLGNYELAGAVVSLLGYPLTVVALAHKDERTNSFFNSRRKMVGIKVMPTGSIVRGCLRALEDKGFIALLGDRDFSNKKTKFKMFSRNAYIPRGPAAFALKIGSTILPSFLIRENKYFYNLIFEKPIYCKKQDNQNEQDIIRQYICILEKYIKKYPDQWYLFEKYWL